MSLNSNIEKSYVGKYVSMDNGSVIYIKGFNYGILRTVLGATPGSVSYYLVDENGDFDRTKSYNMDMFEFTKGHYGTPSNNFFALSK